MSKFYVLFQGTEIIEVSEKQQSFLLKYNSANYEKASPPTESKQEPVEQPVVVVAEDIKSDTLPLRSKFTDIEEAKSYINKVRGKKMRGSITWERLEKFYEEINNKNQEEE